MYICTSLTGRISRNTSLHRPEDHGRQCIYHPCSITGRHYQLKHSQQSHSEVKSSIPPLNSHDALHTPLPQKYIVSAGDVGMGSRITCGKPTSADAQEFYIKQC